MKIRIKTIIFLFFSAASSMLAAQSYVTPPTASTYKHVPVISDEKMEQCVRLYNEAKWVFEEIKIASVDRYNQQSVNSYNAMVNRHTGMTRKFNVECAGKQSRSACEAAKKLNIEQDLPYQDCLP